MRVDLVPAFVLHTRDYTDTRILVELFTAVEGRVSAVARGGRKGPRFVLLRPFQPLLVSWLGRHDLKTLNHFESAGQAPAITGTALYCGMYLNELLLRLLAPADAHPHLFYAYERALTSLTGDENPEPVLRAFELDLLVELGYGIGFDADVETGEPIEVTGHYQFVAGEGFTRVDENLFRPRLPHSPLLTGAEVRAIAERRFNEPGAAAAAKVICRLALKPLLGGRPLKSRELFR